MRETDSLDSAAESTAGPAKKTWSEPRLIRRNTTPEGGSLTGYASDVLAGDAGTTYKTGS